MIENNKSKSPELLDTNIEGLRPVAVVYNITNKTIEDFVFDYISAKGVDIEAVKSIYKKTPNGFGIDTYAFFSPESRDIKSQGYITNSIISQRFDTTSYTVSQTLQNVLRRVTDDTRLYTGGKKNNVLYVKLNMEKVFRLMFALTPNRHDIAVPEIQHTKDLSFIASIIKREVFPKGDSSGDKYIDAVRHVR